MFYIIHIPTMSRTSIKPFWRNRYNDAAARRGVAGLEDTYLIYDGS